MSKYKKLKKRKLALGGNLLNKLHPETGANIKGGGNIMALGQIQDQALDYISNMGYNNIAGNQGIGESNIINKNQQGPLSKIPAIGNQLALGLDTMNAITGKTGRNIKKFRANEQTQNGWDSPSYDVSYALGGSLNDINGPSHEEGGVNQAVNIETEGGETQKDDYIFSDRLEYPGKKTTFAKLSKRIRDKYTGKRPNDKISIEAEERELATLADVQEIVRGEVMESAVQMAYGGSIKKKMALGGYEDEIDYTINPSTGIPFSAPESLQQGFSPNINVTDNIVNLPNYVAPSPNNNTQYPPLNFNQSDADKYNINSIDNNINIVDNPINPTTSKNINDGFGGADALDYTAIGAQLLGPASELYYGLKGGDPVNYKRAKPTMVDLYRAKTLANQEANRSLSAGQESINQSGDTAQRSLSNSRALAIKGAQIKGEQTANIMQNEELQNVGIKNTFEQANTNIANQEQIDRLQETDAARTAVTNGLSDLGANVAGGISTYKKYQNQKFITKYLGTSNWSWTKDGLVYNKDTGETTNPDELGITSKKKNNFSEQPIIQSEFTKQPQSPYTGPMSNYLNNNQIPDFNQPTLPGLTNRWVGEEDNNRFSQSVPEPSN